MNLDKIEEILNEKEWVHSDESIEVLDIDRELVEEYGDVSPLEFKWQTETYFPHVNIQKVIEDSEVVICDIQAEENKPIIYLEWVGEKF